MVDLALPVLLIWPHGRLGRRVGLVLASLFHATNLLLWQARRLPAHHTTAPATRPLSTWQP